MEKFGLLPLVLLLAVAPATRAEVDLEVRADRPSSVYLSSQYVGDTPLVLRNLKPGNHQILVEDLSTRETRTYMIPSPMELMVERELDVRWTLVNPYPPQPRMLAPAPVIVPAPVPVPVPAKRAESLGKTRTRNTLLGATVATQILTGNKKDRQHQRNIGLGAIGLNEIFRR